MSKKADSSRRELRPRQIIGISLPPDIAADVKMEAARRNVSLRQLFQEMWTLYMNKKPS